VQGPLDKVREELAEVEEALRNAGDATHEERATDPNAPGRAPSEKLVEEIGDLLFAVVNLARKAGVHAGPAIDKANRKFRERFEKIEELASKRGIEVESAGLEVLDGLWDEAKGLNGRNEKREQ
jgi:uncharacterized protein YabN with tetrapyrrole methylase and pyrophosphatase domain